MRTVSLRALGLRAPCAPTALGWDIWSKDPEGEGATQPGQRLYATSPRAQHCWGQDEMAQPNFSLRAGKEEAWCARWSTKPLPRVPRTAWHSAFPHSAPGKGIIQLYHPSATQPFPLLLWSLGHFEEESPISQINTYHSKSELCSVVTTGGGRRKLRSDVSLQPEAAYLGSLSAISNSSARAISGEVGE